MNLFLVHLAYELARAVPKIEKEHVVFWTTPILVFIFVVQRWVRNKNAFKEKESNLDYCKILIKTYPSSS